jgi:hypothetical protein
VKKVLPSPFGLSVTHIRQASIPSGTAPGARSADFRGAAHLDATLLPQRAEMCRTSDRVRINEHLQSPQKRLLCSAQTCEPIASTRSAPLAVAAAGVDAWHPRRKDWEAMTDLTAHLEALVRRYAAECDLQPPSAAIDRLGEEFRREIDLLAAQYGQAAVDKAIDALPDARWPSVSLH